MTNILSIKDRVERTSKGSRYVYDVHMDGGKWIVKPKKGKYPVVLCILRNWHRKLNCK